MIKLLIVDDEPLVQAGIKSMINWENLGIRIVGVASNGQIAYNMIREYDVEIVIADVKMPVMSGLDLAHKCYEDGPLPVFIILTGYEDFHFVKEALAYQAVDYLVKLELTPELLIQSLERAISRLSELHHTSSKLTDFTSGNLFKEQFFTRLIFNLFESEHQFLAQSKNLYIDFAYDAFAAGYVEISSGRLNTMALEKQISLYVSSLQMVSELMGKYIPCHTVSLDSRHFCILFFLRGTAIPQYKEIIKGAFRQVSSMVHNYYSVVLLSSVGSAVERPMLLSASYQDAKQIFPQVTGNQPILFLTTYPAAAPQRTYLICPFSGRISEKPTLSMMRKPFMIFLLPLSIYLKVSQPTIPRLWMPPAISSICLYPC